LALAYPIQPRKFHDVSQLRLLPLGASRLALTLIAFRNTET